MDASNPVSGLFQGFIAQYRSFGACGVAISIVLLPASLKQIAQVLQTKAERINQPTCIGGHWIVYPGWGKGIGSRRGEYYRRSMDMPGNPTRGVGFSILSIWTKPP